MLWQRHKARKDAALHYAREFGVDPLTAQVLINRGFNGLEAIRAYLDPEVGALHDPFLMKNMDAAVRRIRRAIVKRERIHLHGDYDVDGISATAVLLIGLRAAGADVHYHIINRNDSSVGLSVGSLHRDHLPHKPAIIITADCGTSSHAAIDDAAKHGVDVIVVDHHMPGTHLPKCAALLNPMQGRCGFPFPSLAAVGVAFNLVYALNLFLQRENQSWPSLPIRQLFDIVALGTISDLVPLTDENRIFVAHGLQLLRSAKRPGICALMRSAKLLGTDDEEGGDSLSARSIGFRLAPLLNAAGRMDDANKCVELLTTDSYRAADAVTRELVDSNHQRQAAEREVLREAVEEAERRMEAGANSLVLAKAGWHPGVLGIVASRLVERFNRPTLVAAVDLHGIAKGSVRSPDTIDMLAVLGANKELLETYGGHRVAAGVAFKAINLDELRAGITREVSRQTPSSGTVERLLEIDATVDFDELTVDVVRQLETLAPFGAGNPEPILETRRVSPVFCRIVNGNNVRARFRHGNSQIDAVGFGMARRVEELRKPVDIAYFPRLIKSGGVPTVELVLRDMVPAK
jgi:single-stranded-DNA-specific exonuclease